MVNPRDIAGKKKKRDVRMYASVVIIIVVIIIIVLNFHFHAKNKAALVCLD